MSALPPQRFYPELSRHSQSLLNENQNLSLESAASIAEGVYRAVAECPHPFVLIGPGRIYAQEELIRNFGLVRCSNDGSYSRGGIFADKPWTMIGNQAFILGAVHARKTVCIVSQKRIGMAQLWNQKLESLTVFGREIAILKLAGYKPIRSGDEILFLPPKVRPKLTLAGILKQPAPEAADLMIYLWLERASDEESKE